MDFLFELVSFGRLDFALPFKCGGGVVPVLAWVTLEPCLTFFLILCGLGRSVRFLDVKCIGAGLTLVSEAPVGLHRNQSLAWLSVCVRSYDSYVPEVDSENAAIVLEPPCLFDDSLPWTVGSQVVAPIHVTDTKIYLESADDLEPGVKVSQSSHVGSLDALFSAFREQWQKRWCRHSNLPHSHREPFVLAMTFSQSIMTHWPAFVVLLLGLRQMGVGLVRSSVAESQA